METNLAKNLFVYFYKEKQENSEQNINFILYRFIAEHSLDTRGKKKKEKNSQNF